MLKKVKVFLPFTYGNISPFFILFRPFPPLISVEVERVDCGIELLFFYFFIIYLGGNRSQKLNQKEIGEFEI